MKNIEELRHQTVDELKAIYRDLSREIYEMKTEFRITKKLEKPHLLRAKKRDRARALTILRQKSQEGA